MAVILSLLSSNPGIIEANNPGRHNINSLISIHNKLFFTITFKYLVLFAKVAFAKKGKRPQAYNPKLSINLASFFEIIL